jgi:hypothetical protein
MILRQIYADAPGHGAVVWNMGSRAREAADPLRRVLKASRYKSRCTLRSIGATRNYRRNAISINSNKELICESIFILKIKID